MRSSESNTQGLLLAATCLTVCLALTTAVVIAAEPSDPGPPPVPVLEDRPATATPSPVMATLSTRQGPPSSSCYGEELIYANLSRFLVTSPGTSDVLAGLHLGARGAETIAHDFTRLYLVTADGDLYVVDTTDGTASLIGTAEVGGEMSDLAEDPTTKTLYAASTDCWGTSLLYTINPATAAATLVGSVSGCPCLVAIAFNQAGALYGYDLEEDRLFSINPATATAIEVGPLGFDANYTQGMDFDPVTDVCYLFAHNAGTGQAELRACNPLSGATILVGQIGPDGVLHSYGDAAIENPIFADGFESGDVTGWSASAP
jgi:hypothetical protein